MTVGVSLYLPLLLSGRPPGRPFRSSRLACVEPVLRLLSLPLSRSLSLLLSLFLNNFSPSLALSLFLSYFSSLYILPLYIQSPFLFLCAPLCRFPSFIFLIRTPTITTDFHPPLPA